MLATALATALCLGPWMIRTLQVRQIGQSVRTDGPQSHLSKKGTPTMGGALILVAIGIATLLWADLRNLYVWVVLGVTISFGAVGWVDDYRKVIEKNSRGLPSRWKYFWQSVFGLAAAIILYMAAKTPVETTLIVPFFKQVEFQLGVLFVVLTYFVIVGSSNAVNLTDGLDGLAIMPVMIAAGTLGIIAYAVGRVDFTDYLDVHYVPGTGEILIFTAGLFGGGLDQAHLVGIVAGGADYQRRRRRCGQFHMLSGGRWQTEFDGHVRCGDNRARIIGNRNSGGLQPGIDGDPDFERLPEVVEFPVVSEPRHHRQEEDRDGCDEQLGPDWL